MRTSELTSRAGKQSDKTREVKLCTIWSTETRDTDDVPVSDAGSVTCSAAIESAATWTRTKIDPSSANAFCAKPAAAASPKPHIPWSLAMAQRGSGTSPGNCFRTPSRSSTGFTSKKPFTGRLTQSMGRPANAPRSGPEKDAKNWTTAMFRNSCAPSTAMPQPGGSPQMRSLYPPQPRPNTLSRIPPSKVSALLPASWKRDAKSPSEPVSNARACTGLFAVPMPSSLFDAAVSADAFRTSGNVELIASPLDLLTFQSCAQRELFGTIPEKRSA